MSIMSDKSLLNSPRMGYSPRTGSSNRVNIGKSKMSAGRRKKKQQQKYLSHKMPYLRKGVYRSYWMDKIDMCLEELGVNMELENFKKRKLEEKQ